MSAIVHRMRVAELRAELDNRGLLTTGKKSILVQRLLDDMEQENLGPTQPSANDSAEPTVDTCEVFADPPGTLDPTGIRELIRAEVRSAITDEVGASLLSQPSTAPAPPAASSDIGVSAACSTPPHAGNLHVPKSAQDRILRGEFVDFDQLLPEILGAVDSNKSFELRSSSSRGALEVVEVNTTCPVHRRVHDIATWLEAWSLYMHVVISNAPHHTAELLSYQCMILAANRQYFAEAWLMYDQQFRRFVASQPGKRFDTIDINTWQLCITGKARHRCRYLPKL